MSKFNSSEKIKKYLQDQTMFSWDYAGDTIAASEFKVSNGPRSTTVLVPNNPSESQLRAVATKIREYFDFFETFYPRGDKT